jgi:hypothetical protein
MTGDALIESEARRASHISMRRREHWYQNTITAMDALVFGK